VVDWVSLYHRLPYPLRVVAASGRGLYLRWWRYGRETERLVEEALEREAWGAERWRAWQEERLAYLLHRAATRVPYYRDYWLERRRRGDRTSWGYLENWPLLEKETLRTHPQAFLAEDCNVRAMFPEHTSGTTGKPLQLWWSKAAVRAWYGLFEARVRRWNGVSLRDRWAILGGQLVTAVRSRKPPFWVWNAAMHQLYLSAYHLAPDLVRYYLDAIRRYRVRYILGYPSALYALAQEALGRGANGAPLAVVLTNAEPLFPYQRQCIEDAFACPVRETYGMAEAVAAASECHAGTLHLWPEVGIVEVLVDGRAARPGEVGELVCTGLLNADMPLVRYRVGDRGALRAPGENCSCGRALPALAQVEGRLDDVLYTADGRQVGRLDPVFKAELPIREAQIIQESLELIRVRYVPAPGFAKIHGETIARRVRERLGPVEVVLEELPEVPRGANGKFRAVICNVPPRQRTEAAG
jgi:phenylacetate-CoA ligase